jgi:hypothetical protein
VPIGLAVGIRRGRSTSKESRREAKELKLVAVLNPQAAIYLPRDTLGKKDSKILRILANIVLV